MSRYPVITAGQRITADRLSSMLTEFAYKADNTDRASTTALADDPDLTIQLAASAVYHIEIFIYHASLTAAQIDTIWTVPGGASGLKSASGPGAGVTHNSTSGGDIRMGVHQFDTEITYAARNNASNLVLSVEQGVVTTSSAGTFALSWAQNVSNATATRVGAGSFMRVMRLA